MDNEYVTKAELKKILEELNVVVADIGAGQPKVAWNHYNTNIFNMSTKKSKLIK